MDLPPDRLPVKSFIQYLHLLEQWNNAYNLTAIKDTGTMVTQHILDSLSVLPFVRGQRCIDIGTGAGLPGLILAMADPSRHWDLLDSNHKKIRFINQVILELELKNVQTLCQRVETCHPEQPYTTITTRAFSDLSRMLKQVGHLLTKGAVLLAMKGPGYLVELDIIDNSTFQVQSHALNVPGLDKPRFLVEIFPLPDKG